MLWVGAGIAIITLVRRLASQEGHEEADRLIDQTKHINNALFLPAVILLLGTGVTMVIVQDAWSFSQPWALIALALFAVAFVDGALIGGRMEKQLDAFREAGEQNSAPSVELFDRYMRWANVSILTWLGMLAMMVFKPGA